MKQKVKCNRCNESIKKGEQAFWKTKNVCNKCYKELKRKQKSKLTREKNGTK